MQIYLYQNEQQVGPFTVDEIWNRIASGSIVSSDLGWHEGLSEWQTLESFLPATPEPPAPAKPLSTPRFSVEKREVQTNVKQGAVIGGWLCFFLGILTMYFSMWTFVIYGPLFIVAFVLSIVAMSQRRILGGIALLLATLVVPTILGLFLFANRTAKLAETLQSAQKPTAQLSTQKSTLQQNALKDTSQPVTTEPLGSQSEPSTPIVAPKPKNPELDAKMGFRTYKLGTAFSQFNPNDLNEGTTFMKTDLRAFFVKDFDKKLGAAEIEDIQLNFVQDILRGWSEIKGCNLKGNGL